MIINIFPSKKLKTHGCKGEAAITSYHWLSIFIYERLEALKFFIKLLDYQYHFHFFLVKR